MSQPSFRAKAGAFFKRALIVLAFMIITPLVWAVIVKFLSIDALAYVRGAALLFGAAAVLILIKATKDHAVALAAIWVLGMGAIFAHNQKADREDEMLANLKVFSPQQYLIELKELRGEQAWKEALAKIDPERHRRIQAEAARDKKARAIKENINSLIDRAKDAAPDGLLVWAGDFGDQWNLTVIGGRLKCEHGPVTNDIPRPLVLLETDNATYALNGAAMNEPNFISGKEITRRDENGLFADGVNTELVKAGLAMCKETVVDVCGDKTEAVVWAHMFMKKQLKRPRSAEFPWAREVKTATDECGAWYVQSYVDSQNTFGTMMRTHFEVVLRKVNKDTWKKVELIVN